MHLLSCPFFVYLLSDRGNRCWSPVVHRLVWLMRTKTTILYLYSVTSVHFRMTCLMLSALHTLREFWFDVPNCISLLTLVVIMQVFFRSQLDYNFPVLCFCFCHGSSAQLQHDIFLLLSLWNPWTRCQVIDRPSTCVGPLTVGFVCMWSMPYVLLRLVLILTTILSCG